MTIPERSETLDQNVDPDAGRLRLTGRRRPAGGETPGRAVRRMKGFQLVGSPGRFGRPFCMEGREALSPHSPNLVAVGFARPFDARSSKRHLSRHG
jgi:hypothetical protein